MLDGYLSGMGWIINTHAVQSTVTKFPVSHIMLAHAAKISDYLGPNTVLTM